jgi:hypothetical protein
MSNNLRTTALAALIRTAASTNQASQRPTNSLSLSIQRDSDSSPATCVPSGRCNARAPAATTKGSAF